MQKEESAKAELELQRAGWIWDISHGDEASFAALYTSTVDLVYNLAYRITGQHALAEEVVEATYFYAWQNALKFDLSRGTPMSWLMVICRSQALILLRSSDQKTIQYVDDELNAEPLGIDNDPQNLLAAIEENTALHAALERLCPRDRQILALAFFRGLTYTEIGVHLEMPVGTIKTRVRLALEMLRTQLKTLRCNNA